MKQTWQSALELARNALRCEAKSRRSGSSCQSPAMPNGRCRMHGGKSPGAPCEEKHGQYKHGLYTKEATAKRLAVSALIRQAQDLCKKVEGLTA